MFLKKYITCLCVSKRSAFKKSLLLFLAFSLLLSTSYGCAIAFDEMSINVSSATKETRDVFVSAEDVSKRGEFEKHYLLSDGSFVAVTYSEAVHYMSDNGVWEEVDNRLSYDDTSARIVNGQGSFAVSFANCPNDASLVSLSHDDRVFSWTLSAEKLEHGNRVQLFDFSVSKANIVDAGVVPATSELSSVSKQNLSYVGKKFSDDDAFENEKIRGKVQYAELFEDAPEVSVEYSVYQNKIEEDIYINAKTALRSFSMRILADGLTARLNDNGSIDFVDENNVVQYCIGAPYMEDANNAVLNDIRVAVEQNERECIVTYTPDEEWLTSEERVYPILLDPSITTKEYNSNIVDTYVCEGDVADHSAEQKLYYGIKSGKVHRAYIKINNLPNIDASMPVLGATMQLTHTLGTTTGKTAVVYKASRSWDPATLTYANQPSLLSANLLDTCEYDSSVMTMTFELTNDVTALYDEFLAAVNYGYIVKYADESTEEPDYNAVYSTEYTAAVKRPVITINYGYSLPPSLTNGGVYSFQNDGSLSYMAVHNGIDANDVNVYQQSVSSFSNLGMQHKFKLEYVASTGGYYLRAMCSSNGTNRVLDVVKSDGYVKDGGNVQIYSAVDPLAQHWFIIGTDVTSFRIVPRTDMSLALTVCPGGDGGASGTTSTSTGNIYVATYDETNSYQDWMIKDEDGDLMTTSTQRIQNGTYYLNNISYGKYLHKASSGSINAASGLISTLGNTIRWKITHVGNNYYTIQSTDDLTKYLCAKSSTSVVLSTMAAIDNTYLWSISTATGGGTLIRNAETQSYIKQTGTYAVSATLSLGTAGTSTYRKCVWRLASTDFYGNTASHAKRELKSGFSISCSAVDAGETIEQIITPYPTNAIWSNVDDFTYTTANASMLSVNGSTITSISAGNTSVTATHKVTGLSSSFSVAILPGTFDVYIYASGLSFENMAAGSMAGHGWIEITSHSAHEYTIGHYRMCAGETITIGKWGTTIDEQQDDFLGLWYNREVYEYNINGKYSSYVCAYETVDKSVIDQISTLINSSYSGYNLLSNNCVHFATRVWNLCVNSERKIDAEIYLPSDLVDAIEAFDNYYPGSTYIAPATIIFGYYDGAEYNEFRITDYW